MSDSSPISRRKLLGGLAEWVGGPTLAQLKAQRALRVYFIGNSVTDTVNYNGLAELAKSRGITQIWGRHMIPGAPLFYMWREKGGFKEEPFGVTQDALRNYAWDAITVQPFDRHLVNDNDEGDLANIQHILDLATVKNPDVQLYIYARWPRITKGGKGFAYDKNDYDPRRPGSGVPLDGADDFHARWTAKYTGGWDGTNESRDYFDQVLRSVQKANPKLRKPPLLIPIGHVMDALDAEMRANRVPGYKSVHQLYRDAIHLNRYGSYLVGCAFFATLYRQTPIGLSAAPYGDLDPTIAAMIQRTVWRITESESLVSRH